MTITNRLGRPMIAAMFVSGGVDQLRNPDEKVDAAAAIVDEIDERVDAVSVPQDTRDAVRINGAVQLVAGGLLAINRVPRLAATALAASLVPTTLAGHRFWEVEDEKERAQQRTHFLKNVAMLGGLMITIGDTGREPSMGWRARRALRKTNTEIAQTAAGVRTSAKEFRRAGSETAASVVDSIGDVASAATDALPTASAGGPDFSTPDFSRAADDARNLAHGLRDASAPARKAVLARAKDLASRARSVDVASRRDDLATQARDLADRAAELSRVAAAKLPDVNVKLAR